MDEIDLQWEPSERHFGKYISDYAEFSANSLKWTELSCSRQGFNTA